jgi:hypothetical protein
MEVLLQSPRISSELRALACDVLQFLRRIEEAARKSTEAQKSDLLFLAWRTMDRAGEVSEAAAKSESHFEQLIMDRIASMRIEITHTTRVIVRSTGRAGTFGSLGGRREPQS